MGHQIEKIVESKGFELVSTIDPAQNAKFKQITKESLKDAEVCIDFTIPGSAIDNIRKIAKLRKNIVIGTTGWYDKLSEARKIVKSNNIGLIYGSNFSIGVNVFYRMVENASKLMNKLDHYDVFGYEIHHNRKIDSPSGTAKYLGSILLNNIKRKKSLLYDKIDRKINRDELHFASVRAGFIPGTHVIGFDSGADTIELKHTARNREGFALGAVMAAQWIKGKKGFYCVEDMVKDMLGDNNV